MLEILHRPLPPRQSLLAALGVVAGVAIYCLTYTALTGRSEAPAAAAGWAIANVLPWFAVFEIGKRSASSAPKALLLGVALAVSLSFDFILGQAGGLAFELVRRLPALLLTVALFAAAALQPRDARRTNTLAIGELPLAPAQLDWVAAAGNYVELHGRGRTVIHRAPLSRVETQLADHGFVRVHRSILVRRDRIARVRPLDVVLHDGTSLRTGKRYRAALQS